MHGTSSSRPGFLILGSGICGAGIRGAGILAGGISWAASALAQDVAPATPVAPASSPPADASSSTSPTVPPQEFSPGFEAGLRLGIGLPVGDAGKGGLGDQRKIGDLVSWRVPVWVDITYRVSPTSSYGLYGQMGVGGTGDLCSGKCNWTDLRVGFQGAWRLNPGESVDPWLGLGLGLESLSFQSFETQTGEDGEPLPLGVITRERLMGPELLLQGGLALRVEDSLWLGPYVSASVGSYVGDHYSCIDLNGSLPCSNGSSVDGSAFHAWLGIGVSGSYTP
jgi:hypothetical protein